MAGGGARQEASLEDDEIIEQGSFTEPNIVPLVDIMLVLLVILMAGSSAIVTQGGEDDGSGFRVALPAGTENKEVSSVTNELVVVILKEGPVVVRGEPAEGPRMAEIFKEEATADAQRLVLVQADEDATHRRVVEVMEAARKAGLTNLAIATQPETP